VCDSLCILYLYPNRRPERWLERPTLPTAYQYPVFNAGPRLCLGQRLAELEGVYALVGLLQRFKFKMAPGAPPVTYAFSTSLPMKNGLQVVVERRQGAGVGR
jgi:cytochrome P450